MKCFIIRTSALCAVSLCGLVYGAQPQPDNWFHHDLQDMQRRAAARAWEKPETPCAELVNQGMFSEINIVPEATPEQLPDINATIQQEIQELDALSKEYDKAGFGLLDRFKPTKAQKLLTPQAQFSLYRKVASIQKFINEHQSKKNVTWNKKLQQHINYFDKAIQDLRTKLAHWQKQQEQQKK